MQKAVKAVNAYLNAYEDDFIVSDGDPGRYFYLRPSSFPYCGFEKLLSAPSQLDAPRLNTFASTYFTEVGHTTHHVFQAFGARGGKIVGDWECKACGKWRKFSCDNVCGCGSHMHYHELEVRYKGTIVGHLDGLFRLEPKLGTKSPHILMDYKTTSSKKITEARNTPHKSGFPYRYNVYQIEAYVPLVEAQYGISVDYWMLIYLARDAPFKWGRHISPKHLTQDDKDKILKRLNRWVKTHHAVLTASTKADFEAVESRKLCKSKIDYETNFKDDYNPCPHCDKCFTAPEVLISKALKHPHKVYPLIEHAPKGIKKTLKEVMSKNKGMP